MPRPGLAGTGIENVRREAAHGTFRALHRAAKLCRRPYRRQSVSRLPCRIECGEKLAQSPTTKAFAMTPRLTGIHHLTAVSAHAATTRFLHRRARHAAGEEDRQPGRCLRLPSVLRRRRSLARHRPHLLRLAGRPRAARHHAIVRTALRVAGARPRVVEGPARAPRDVPVGDIAERDGRLACSIRGPRRPAPDARRRRRRRAGARGSAPVPADHQIRGLGPITLSVPDSSPTDLC